MYVSLLRVLAAHKDLMTNLCGRLSRALGRKRRRVGLWLRLWFKFDASSSRFGEMAYAQSLAENEIAW